MSTLAERVERFHIVLERGSLPSLTPAHVERAMRLLDEVVAVNARDPEPDSSRAEHELGAAIGVHLESRGAGQASRQRFGEIMDEWQIEPKLQWWMLLGFAAGVGSSVEAVRASSEYWLRGQR